MCPRRTTAYRGNGFVERREDPRVSDHGRDAMPVHVGAQVGIDPGENDGDSPALEIMQQVADGLCGGIIDIRDRAASTMNQRTGVGAPCTSARTSSAKRLSFA